MTVRQYVPKILLSLVLFGLVKLVVAVLVFFAVMDGQVYSEPFMQTGGIVVYLLVVLRLFNLLTTKRRVVLFSVAAAIALVATAIKPIRYAYEQRIPTVTTEVNIRYYEPFTGSSKLARLQHPASLQLEQPLPTLDGATALYPMYAAFAEAVYPAGVYNPFDRHHSNRQITMTKTPQAYQRLSDSEVDVIFVAGPDDEQRAQAGPQLELTPIGKEAFVFFVNRKNPVNSLTVEQIQGIYSGEITNWKEVGGNNEAIQAFQRPAGSGSQSALVRFMEGKVLEKAPEESVVAFMGGIIEEVANYRNYSNAIGYSFRYFSTEMIKNGEIKLIAVDGVAPTKDTIRSGEYPITELLYAATAGTENPQVQPFIAWILSEEGQELVEKSGYIALSAP